MPRITTKDVEINGLKYQLRKMPALTASRLSNLLISVLMKMQDGKSEPAQAPDEPESSISPDERASGMVAVLWLSAAGVLDKESYQDIQKDCLMASSCYEVADAPPVVVMMPDGRWSNKDLEAEPETVNRLIVESLQFNIAPFFRAGASRAAAGVREAMKPHDLSL